MGFGYGNGISHDADAIERETGNRVAKTFDNSMLAHVWAQGVQTFGQSNNGNFYFHGRILFSYGTHFAVGYITESGDVLLNADSYSVSTGRHQSEARAAVRGRVIYYVPDLTRLLDLQGRGANFGDLASTESLERHIDSNLSNRAKVRRFVESVALSIDGHAGQYLLERVGLPRSFDSIKRDAEKERGQVEAQEARQKLDNAKARLKAIAFAYRAGTLGEHMAARTSRYNLRDRGTAAHMIETTRKLIRSDRRVVAKGNMPPAQWRDAWEAHNALEGMESEVAAVFEAEADKLGKAEAREQMRHAIRTFRNPLDSTCDAAAERCAHPYELARVIVNACRKRATAAQRLADRLGTFPAGTAERLNAAADALRLVEYDAQESGHLLAMRTAYDEWQDEKRKAEQAEREKARAEYKRAWLAGEVNAPEPGRHGLHFSRDNGAAYIRAIGVQRDESGAITGGKLETSQGAEVPLVHAIRAFRFIKLVRERGEAWHKNGQQIRVGHFTLDSISPAGDMVAGCHKFDWQDIAQLASDLGVFEVAPSDDAVSKRAVESA